MVRNDLGGITNASYLEIVSISRNSTDWGCRLKLDLLITAGNARWVAVATMPDPVHTLLNLHFVIPTLPFVIVVISGYLFPGHATTHPFPRWPPLFAIPFPSH
ncbi:hypothetical protein M0802_004649 [Mischocyttarus mexicanus]|nr:hypothetical protein M0802_004649 [Mischocyttarus mexicanus]